MNKYTVPRNCALCGAAFLAREDLVRAGLARWCSRRCATRARPPFKTTPLADRFWPKIDKAGPIPPHRPELGPCHVWTGGHDTKGYGRISLGGRKGRMEVAHRVAFFLAEGRWPDPCALHHCDNPPCVRRSHLFEGTYADNMADCATKGRIVLPNVRGEANPASRLTVAEVLQIRASSASRVATAKRFGIVPEAVSSIVLRRTWKHI
jgi:hypothetical protein